MAQKVQFAMKSMQKIGVSDERLKTILIDAEKTLLNIPEKEDMVQKIQSNSDLTPTEKILVAFHVGMRKQFYSHSEAEILILPVNGAD